MRQLRQFVVENRKKHDCFFPNYALLSQPVMCSDIREKVGTMQVIMLTTYSAQPLYEALGESKRRWLDEK